MSKSLLKSKRAQAYALLLINTILWGFSAPIIKKALDYVTVNQFLFGRYLIASLLFIPIYFLLRTKKKNGIRHANWKLLIFLALLGTPLTLIPLYEGLKLTSSLEAAILAATTPIIVILGSRLFLREKISVNEGVGIFVALLGTLILTLEPAFSNGFRLFTFSVLGNLLIIASNLIWAAFLIITKKVKADPDQISLVSYLTSVPVFLILLLLESPLKIIQTNPGHPIALFGILYMAIFGSVIAFWAYTKGQALIPAGEASIFTYLQPIFTFPLAYFWLGESISQLGLFACLLLAAGVYFSEYHGRPSQ
ncbi:MAG: DMT family transporter [Patescibacteria group bacterium]